MKRLLLVLAMLIIAGSAFAADLKVSGSAYVRGTTLSNMDLEDGDEATFSYFDYDVNINADFVANEKATVKTKLTYDRNISSDGVVSDSDSASTLAVERAYLNYKFAPFLQLNTGLMGGGQWASSFGDSEINVMRVQFIGALSKDMIFIATYEKQDEAGFAAWGSDDTTNKKNFEKDDKTVYYLASSLTFGPVKILPLFTYATQGLNNDQELAALGITKKYDFNVKAFTLGLQGDFGMFGFEAEGVYKKMDTDGFADDNAATLAAAATATDTAVTNLETALAAIAAGEADPSYAGTAAALAYAEGVADTIEGLQAIDDTTTYGYFIDLFVKFDPAKIGFVYAYGSADEEDGSYNWGDDFDMFIVMDDYVANDDAGLTGFTAYKLYANATFGAVSVGVAAGMGSSNADWATSDFKDSKFTEYDAYVAYAIDENTTYSIAGGFAQTEDFYAANVDADAYRVYHKFAVKF